MADTGLAARLRSVISPKPTRRPSNEPATAPTTTAPMPFTGQKRSSSELVRETGRRDPFDKPAAAAAPVLGSPTLDPIADDCLTGSPMASFLNGVRGSQSDARPTSMLERLPSQPFDSPDSTPGLGIDGTGIADPFKRARVDEPGGGLGRPAAPRLAGHGRLPSFSLSPSMDSASPASSGPSPASAGMTRAATTPTSPAGFRHHRRSSSSTIPSLVKETLDAQSSENPTDGSRTLNQYSLGEAIGKGSFGSVVAAVDSQTGVNYACKEFSKARLRRRLMNERMRANRRSGMPRSPARSPSGNSATPPLVGEEQEDSLALIRAEIAVLKRLRHPNIAGLVEVLDEPAGDSLYMILEVRGLCNLRASAAHPARLCSRDSYAHSSATAGRSSTSRGTTRGRWIRLSRNRTSGPLRVRLQLNLQANPASSRVHAPQWREPSVRVRTAV